MYTCLGAQSVYKRVLTGTIRGNLYAKDILEAERDCNLDSSAVHTVLELIAGMLCRAAA